jgi:prolyl 4-hydroxylase
MWPGVRKGFVRQHPTLPFTIRTLSVIPLVLEVAEEFVSPSEISLIKRLSEPHMKSSGVSLMDKDKGKAATEWRTSSTYFLPTKDHALLQEVDERVANLTFIPLSHSELIQVLRYGPTQKYDGHHDYFDPSLYKGDPSTIRLIGKDGERNR